MVKPDSNNGRLIKSIHERSGQRAVNRTYCPPLSVYNQLIKKGYVTTTRIGLRTCRTTMVIFTAAGEAMARKLFGSFASELQQETNA